MKILVTGATGFVGHQLMPRLKEEGHVVRALVRSSSDSQRLKNLGIQLCYGDINNPGSLKEAVQGVEAVIHMASKVGQAGDRSEFFRINVEGTRCLLESLDRHSIRRFIHISSLSVIAGYQDHYGSDEQAPYLPTGENYADTKIESEKLVLKWHKEKGVPVVILRPGFIYGPGDRIFLPTIIENLKRKKIILIDHGKKLLNVTYVDNLVEAIRLSLTEENILGEVFNISDGEEISKIRFLNAIVNEMDLPCPNKSMPFWFARLLCSLMTNSYTLLKIKSPPPLTRMKLRFLGQNQGFDISKARTLLKYENQLPFEQAVHRAVTWYRDHENEFKNLSER